MIRHHDGSLQVQISYTYYVTASCNPQRMPDRIQSTLIPPNTSYTIFLTLVSTEVQKVRIETCTTHDNHQPGCDPQVRAEKVPIAFPLAWWESSEM
jgi:hypothetical protein